MTDLVIFDCDGVLEDSEPISRIALPVQAARAAGMHVFAYSGGLTPADVLAGPRTIVFEDMRSLAGLLS
jgi:beta-phosphoglucomutase-like phosphatase (HAD superfamily)